MPAVNGVGELGAGEPHAQFEVAGAGNGATPVGHLRVPGRCAEKRHHDGLVGTQPTVQSLPRQRSTLLRLMCYVSCNRDHVRCRISRSPVAE